MVEHVLVKTAAHLDDVDAIQSFSLLCQVLAIIG
jgi:hypothetical protein